MPPLQFGFSSFLICYISQCHPQTLWSIEIPAWLHPSACSSWLFLGVVPPQFWNCNSYCTSHCSHTILKLHYHQCHIFLLLLNSSLSTLFLAPCHMHSSFPQTHNVALPVLPSTTPSLSSEQLLHLWCFFLAWNHIAAHISPYLFSTPLWLLFPITSWSGWSA